MGVVCEVLFAIFMKRGAKTKKQSEAKEVEEHAGSPFSRRFRAVFDAFRGVSTSIWHDFALERPGKTWKELTFGSFRL